MAHKHISLRGEQDEAFEDAAGLVRDDFDNSNMTDAEVIKRLADAYRGKL